MKNVPALPQTPAAGENCLAAQHVRRVPWGLAWGSGETWSKTNKSLPILHNSTMFSISLLSPFLHQPYNIGITIWNSLSHSISWITFLGLPYNWDYLSCTDNLSTSFNSDVKIAVAYWGLGGLLRPRKYSQLPVALPHFLHERPSLGGRDGQGIWHLFGRRPWMDDRIMHCR